MPFDGEATPSLDGDATPSLNGREPSPRTAELPDNFVPLLTALSDEDGAHLTTSRDSNPSLTSRSSVDHKNKRFHDSLRKGRMKLTSPTRD